MDRRRSARVRRALGSFVGAALVFAGSACGGADCESIGYPALAVRVQDAAGEQVCDAVVTVTDGEFSEILPASDTSGDCVYFGPFERAGTYRVDVALDGATGAVAGIEVTRRGDCDRLQTVQVAVELDG
jgi:hypothetical protein